MCMEYDQLCHSIVEDITQCFAFRDIYNNLVAQLVILHVYQGV